MAKSKLEKHYPDLSKVEGSTTHLFGLILPKLTQFEEDRVDVEDIKEFLLTRLKDLKPTPKTREAIYRIEQFDNMEELYKYVGNSYLKGCGLGSINQ